jgi:phosphatidylglycerophosphatase C
VNPSSPEPSDSEALSDGPVVAAFDFDGTLTRGGSVWKFLVCVAGRAKVVRAGLGDLPKILRAAIAGGKANDAAKEALFLRLLAGRHIDTVSKQAADFGRTHFEARCRPDVCRRLRWHLDQGHRVLVVSASPEIYLAPVSVDLGAAGLIATRLEIGAGRELTGHFDGPNCRGPEKARRLHEWIEDNTPGAFVWAYGNSAGDLEMLSNADIGINAGKLGRFGKLRGFAAFDSLARSTP